MPTDWPQNSTNANSDTASPRELGRHLRGVGLQRVVQHVEAEADEGDGGWREPRRGHGREHGVARGERDSARDGKTRLPQAGHQHAGGPGVDERADAEGGEDRADHAEAETEALVQLGADVGECAEHRGALEERGAEDDAHPAIL